MNIEFKYSLDQKILFTGLDVSARIVSILVTKTGIQYEIYYYYDGNRKHHYVFEDEIKKFN